MGYLAVVTLPTQCDCPIDHFNIPLFRVLNVQIHLRLTHEGFGAKESAAYSFMTAVKFINNETDFDTVLECYKRHRVDSFSDLPGNYFWEEFFERCPNSKVRYHH